MADITQEDGESPTSQKIFIVDFILKFSLNLSLFFLTCVLQQRTEILMLGLAAGTRTSLCIVCPAGQWVEYCTVQQECQCSPESREMVNSTIFIYDRNVSGISINIITNKIL